MSTLPTASWKNLDADVCAWSNQLTLRLFMTDVVDHSLEVIESRIVELSKSEDASDAFRCADMKEVLRSTAMAFCLSIQSIWERQIRSYLTECIREQKSVKYKPEDVQYGAWEKPFAGLRGINPSTFKCYSELRTMALLANVCRHGDGKAANSLWKTNKEFWPPPLPPIPGLLPMAPLDLSKAPSSMAMVVPAARLRSFASAISDFWEEVRYFSLEAIQVKHPSLVAELELLRTERAKTN